MYVQQLYTNCLSEAAYYIESDGEAAIVDPIRETEPYLELAKARGAKIKYVLETHFHADFVSGHIDLAKQTGAQIVFGPLAETNYKVHQAKDGEELKVGKITLRVLHTPGHTPESACYLLLDEAGKEYCIFTGDTLFVGDVGRPDLLDGKMSREELAGYLYDSLNQKIKTLPDETLVYPAHGPGSACGKSIGKETWSTIGEQKRTNYAMRDIGREQFIKEVIEGLTPPPSYFFDDARINKEGYESIGEVLKKNVKPLSLPDFEQEVNNGALILDTRVGDEFAQGYIKGAMHIGLNGTYAHWAGTLIDINRPLVIVAETGKEEESILRLARVGYENVKGYLSGGVETWIKAGKPVEKIECVDASEFAARLKKKAGSILDIRRPSETEAGYLKGAALVPLQELSDQLNEVPREEPLYVHCARGYRSMIAISMLKANGFGNLVQVSGGWNKIKLTPVEIVTPAPAAI